MEKLYYSINEVCEQLKLKPHIIRYWESEIPRLKKGVSPRNTRRYTAKDIDLLRKIKELIYEKKYTLEGAKAELKKRKLNSEQVAENNIVTNDLKNELLEIKKLLLSRKE